MWLNFYRCLDARYRSFRNAEKVVENSSILYSGQQASFIGTQKVEYIRRDFNTNRFSC